MSAPRVFYVNERHELERGERSPRGRTATFLGIDWTAKAQALLDQIRVVSRTAARFRSDPTSKDHLFLMATPERQLWSPSTAKDAHDGKKERNADFKDEDARVLRKLGFDVLSIEEDGNALLHLDKPRLEQIESRLALLDKAGKSDKNRWAPVEALKPTTPNERLDLEWLQPLPPEDAVEFVAKLPAMLTPIEAEAVQRAILRMLERGRGEALTEAGTDLSGRAWVVGTARPSRLRLVASELQALHVVMAPIRLSPVGSPPPRVGASAARAPPRASAPKPVVAVVDCGVPEQHRWLKDFRVGRFTAGHPSHDGAHGSSVAGVVVHGYVAPGDPMTGGDCAFIDVNVANPTGGRPLADRVIEALRNTINNAPDARTVNLSIGSALTLAEMTLKQRQECVRLTRDLDNLAAALDVAIVVASGNTMLQPPKPYPQHFDDERWSAGTWAPGANVMTVGAFASAEQILGGATVPANAGWPSPFTRTGRSPIKTSKPDFSAPGGTLKANWQRHRGNQSYDERGIVEDIGTSFAAPQVAREAAFALQALQAVCPEGVKAFAVTARAVLTLTARAPEKPKEKAIQKVFKDTLGRGRPSASPLTHPDPSTALVVWQGEIETSVDVVRFTLPIPRAWLEAATDPQLRMVWAWDAPVDDAGAAWTCRTVRAQLRASLDEAAPALEESRTAVKAATAWRESCYRLRLPCPTSDKDAPLQAWPDDGLWSVSIRYDETAALPLLPTVPFSTRQRVGIAIELADPGGDASPQDHLQALELTASMNRLSVALSTPNVVTLSNRPR